MHFPVKHKLQRPIILLIFYIACIYLYTHTKSTNISEYKYPH